jgi:hypothetical protein
MHTACQLQAVCKKAGKSMTGSTQHAALISLKVKAQM